MIFKSKRNIDDISVQINENTANVVCKMANCKDMIKNIQIGESITTNEAFDMNFNGFASTWKIIFYPKGQYDFGQASEDTRVYIKLISCDKSEIKANICIYLISPSSFPSISSVSQHKDVMFIVNDKCRNWAGPFTLDLIDDEDTAGDNLQIKILIKIISNDSRNTVNCKRSSSEIDSPPTINDPPKKTRSLSPFAYDEDNDTSVDNSKSGEVKTSTSPSVAAIPNPFTKKSPLQYSRLTQPSKNVERDDNKKNCQTIESSANEPRGRFKFRQSSSRNGIFTPEERSEMKELKRLSLDPQQPTEKPPTRISSRCLTVFDIVNRRGADKEDTQSGTEGRLEMSTSETDMVRILGITVAKKYYVSKT